MENKVLTDPSLPLETRAESYVPEAWNTVKTAYTQYRQGVMESRLRYANQQWLAFDKDTRVWKRELPKDDWVPMPNINRFGPWIDGIASNFAAVPEIEAVPVPIDDPIKMGIADICNQLSDHAIKDNALRSDYGTRGDKSNLARQMFTLAGCVFTRVRMEEMQIGEKPAPGGTYSMDEMAQPAQAPQTLTKPRVIVELEDPMWFSPRPGAKTMDDIGWFIIARRVSVDEVEERTGIEAKADGEYPDGYNLSYQNELNYWYLGYSTPAEKMQDSCLLVEFFCEPGKKKSFPEGCHAYYFNGKVQVVEPWDALGPVDNPITKADGPCLPGIFFPRAVAFELCEIQAQLSRYDSYIELHTKTNAAEPIVIDENTKVSEITGRADKIVYWRSIGPGSKEPHRMQHGQLDPAVYERVKYLEQKGESIAATVSVFRGEQPGSITAASAIAQLRGQAEMQFANPVKAWNNLWKETIRKCLYFYQRYPIDELVKIVGQDKISQINDFMQAKLEDCIELIATSNGLPRTRDERRQEMMVLFDKGALDINDPQVRQKAFELFGETGMMDSFNEDATRCRSNVRMIKEMRGMPPFRPLVDDANIHHAIATSAAKQMDFDQWPPPAQQALMQYIEQVTQAVQAQQPPDPNIAKAQIAASSQKQLSDDKNKTAIDVALINASVKENAVTLDTAMQYLKHASDLLMGMTAPQPEPGEQPQQ